MSAPEVNSFFDDLANASLIPSIMLPLLRCCNVVLVAVPAGPPLVDVVAVVAPLPPPPPDAAAAAAAEPEALTNQLINVRVN